MINQKKALIGVFVVGGLSLILMCVLLLGGAKLFQAEVCYWLEFSHPVNGLSKGAAVLFNGVKIGEVRGIKLIGVDIGGEEKSLSTWDENTESPENYDIERWVTEVEICIFPEKLGLKAEWYEFWMQKNIEFAVREIVGNLVVNDGLRAQTKLASILTGQMCINLGYFNDKVPYHVLVTDVINGRIPTHMSPMDKLLSSLTSGDNGDVFEQFLQGGHVIGKYIAEGKLEKLLNDVSGVCENAKKISGNMDKNMPETMEKVNAMLVEAKDAMTQAKGTMSEAKDTLNEIKGVVRQNSAVGNQLMETMLSIEHLSNTFNDLGNHVDDDPQILIFGE